MSDQILAHEERKILAENSTTVVGKSESGSATGSMQGKGWIKGTLGMAICCAAPLLLVVAVSFFGFSLGALAGGALSIAAVLACPVGMFLMMQLMMKDKN